MTKRLKEPAAAIGLLLFLMGGPGAQELAEMEKNYAIAKARATVMHFRPHEGGEYLGEALAIKT